VTKNTLSKISCVVDSRLAATVEASLSDMAIPEAFVQRGKQVSLLERSGLLGFGARVDLAEARAEIFRFYVPSELEVAAARRVAAAADLYLPGRGTLFAEDVELRAPDMPAFDPEAIASACVEEGCKAPRERYAALCCIVQRGMAESLARTVLDMGLCVPIVSYGEGMGLRNRLGLLRITIPVDKEVLYFVVPERDADLLETLAVHKARLDKPGQGFIYRFGVRAYAVNLKVRGGSRNHAASMEQVISALDELRGSSEWRRQAPAKSRPRAEKTTLEELSCLSLIAEEGSVGDYVRAAMDLGAGGATLVNLARRRYDGGTDEGPRPAAAREGCDLIVPRALADAIMAEVEARGLFAEGRHGMAELSSVARAVTYAG